MFRKYFSWLSQFFDGKQNKFGVNNELDKKLLRKIHPHKIPSLQQLKYLPHFLNTSEKKIFSATSLILIVAIIGWAVYSITSHTQLVPVEGGEYTEAIVGQPKYINPLFTTTNDVDADLAYLIYNGLFRYDEQGQLTTDLAESYTISPDQKTYDITLKKNIVWSDGEPFSANDVIFTFDAIQSPETGSPLITAFQGVEIDKTGEFSIRFSLKEPFASFLNSLTVGILPEHSWSDIPPSGMRLAKYNLQPIGTGAWKFSKMLKDDSGNISSYSLEPNLKYYNNKPYLKNIKFKFFNDINEAVTALRGQNVSGMSFIPHNLKEKIGTKNQNLYSFRLPQYTALFFNQSNSATLKSYNTRLALAEAINKELIVKQALNGDGQITNAPILPGMIGYNENIKSAAYNLQHANELLDKKTTRIQPEDYFKLRHDELSKLYQVNTEQKNTPTATDTPNQEVTEEQIDQMIRKEMSSDQTFYRKTDAKELLKITITTVDTPEYIKTAEIIAQMWRSIGVQTEISTINARQIVREAIKERRYQVLLYGEVAGADSDLYSFWHSSQSNYPGLNLSLFSNRDADKLLEDGRTVADPNQRAKIYQKLQQVIDDELPAIFLYTPTYIMAVSKEIKGVTMDYAPTPADRFNNINNWYTKTTRKWLTK